MKDSDFCPVCKYYLYLDQNDKTLRRICRNCGFQEEDKKGGLILEIDLKEKTSEGYKILMNEFTKKDPTLPHVNTIKCSLDQWNIYCRLLCLGQRQAATRDSRCLCFGP